MSSNFGTVAVLAVVVVVAAAFLAIKARALAGQSSKGSVPGFKRKPFLTANELEFLGRLEAAAPELRFHAQVSMGALIDPAASRKDGKEYFRARGMFSQKIVDYVAQRRSDGSIVAVIELDDRTHDSAKDGKRDAMLASAGYKVARWNSKQKPDAAAIRAELIPSAAPQPATARATGSHGLASAAESAAPRP